MSSPRPTDARRPGQRKALVIGNSAYVYIPPLKNPTHDADLIATTLSAVEFSVTKLKDLNAERMKQALGGFYGQLSPSDVALVYFSGHTFQYKEGGRLVPVDFHARYEYEVVDSTLSLDTILEALSSAKAKPKIVILDAVVKLGIGSGWAETSIANDETLVGYASKADEIAFDSINRDYSTYTFALAQEIVKPGRTIEAVMKAVTKRVVELTRGENLPWIYANLTEDFYFVTGANPVGTMTPQLRSTSPLGDITAGKTDDALWENLRSFMRWDVFPKDYKAFLEAFVVNVAAAGIMYFLVVLGLYCIAPAHFAAWHEWIANTGIPFSENVSKILAPFLVDTPHCLNAVVRRYRQRSRKVFDKAPEVKTRPKWVPAPLILGDELIHDYEPPPAEPTAKPYVAGLQEMKTRLGQGDERWTISIEGPVGVGKSALAFEIARWASDSRAAYRLASFPMLPVLLGSLEMGADKAKTVDDAVKAELRFLMNVPNISDRLLQALLRRKRVLVVFDGLSETSRNTDDIIRPEKGTVYTQALVITSRVSTNLPESLVIRPQGLTLAFLDRVLDGLIAANVGPDRFNDDEREELRRHVRSLIDDARDGVKEGQVPMMFLKLMIERADQLLKEKKQLDELPRTLSELVTDYAEQLLRNEQDLRLAMHQARTTAQVCMGKERSPAARSEDRYTAKGVSKEILDKFVTAGLMVRSGEKGDPFYKFALDPIAGQLEANRVVVDIREDRADQTELDELVRRWEELPQDFVRALRRAAARYRQEICASQSAVSLKLWPQAIDSPELRRLLELTAKDPREAIRQSWILLAKEVLRVAKVRGENFSPFSEEINTGLKRLKSDVSGANHVILKWLQLTANKAINQSKWAYDPSEAEEFVRRSAAAIADLGKTVK